MNYKNYYDILGVSKSASAKEIKAAFRKLARKYHPDVNPGDKAAEARFKEINEAYEVLSDTEKRKRYDQFGADYQRYQETGQQPGSQTWGFDFGQAGAGRPPGGFRSEYGTEGPTGFSDFFELLFGTGAQGRRRTGTWQGRRTQAMRGEDYEQAVEITLEDAFNGTERVLQLQTTEACPTCGGTGVAQNKPCPTCQGVGIVQRSKRIEAKIPPGVQTGSRVRIAGQGAPGFGGGPAGDLYLKVTVLPHPVFEVKGVDLYEEVPVDLYTAVLGGEVEVSTIKGKLALTIPPETQNGKTFRLRGQGMPSLRQSEARGDLYAKVRVVLPTRLSTREKELFRELQGARVGSGVR